LIEEVARFYGYDKIPPRLPPIRVLEPLSAPIKKTVEKLRQILFHHGFDEVINFSFSAPEKESNFQNGRKEIEIRNPISSRASLLRTNLVGGLLENIVWNRNRGAEGINIFEMGNIYFWDGERCKEQLWLGIVSTGKVGAAHWQAKNECMDFFYLKGACESLMTNLGFEPFSFYEKKHPYFEDEYSLSLKFKGQEVGYLGLLKKEILDAFSLKEAV
ncbi:unnamed protein product, partial [marine sediment metagenome]